MNPLVANEVAKSMKKDDGSPSATFYAVVVLGSLAIVGIVYAGIKVAEAVGLKDTAEEKNLQRQAELTQGGLFWTPTFYKQEGGLTLTDGILTKYANQLNTAMYGDFWIDGLGTDEESIAGVFRQLQTKGNISRVVEIYNNKYNSDLLADLNDELGLEDFAEYVSKPISMYN